MATINAGNPTISDVARRLDPDGKVAGIVEILKKTNEILEDGTYIEGNLPTGHVTTVRSGLPSVTWRLLNYGVQPSKSRSVKVTDTTGMLEAYAEIDKELADLNGNSSSFRLSEDVAFLEAMAQEDASTTIYGNTNTDPEKFMGLAPRYNSTSAENGENIISGGGTGSDNTSIWLVTWSPQTCHYIYPKGSQVGIQHKDLGEVTLDDSQSPAGRFQGYRTHYQLKKGLCLRDWRYVVRIPNIDVSDLTKDAATGADLVDLMAQALEILPSQGIGRPVFYCNKTIKSFLRRQMKSNSNVNLDLNEVGGKHVMSFDGVPVKKVDAILNTEAVVS